LCSTYRARLQTIGDCTSYSHQDIQCAVKGTWLKCTGATIKHSISVSTHLRGDYSCKYRIWQSSKAIQTKVLSKTECRYNM